MQHPKPYKVSWIDTTSLSITEQCQVPLKMAGYHDNIWFDVISMDVDSIILGRPWLYDLDVILYRRSNSCTFVYKGQKIRINPIEPKPKTPIKPNKVLNKQKLLHLVSAKTMEHEVQKQSVIFALVAIESTEDQN